MNESWLPQRGRLSKTKTLDITESLAHLKSKSAAELA